MYLSKLAIKNFRLLKDVEISLDPSLTMFVGKNNSGKTSIMQLVQNILVDSKPVLRFDDYPLVSRQLLYEAVQCLWNGEIHVDGFLEEIDITSIRFTVDYSQETEDESLGGLAPFIIDLDDNISNAVIDFRFDICPQITDLLQTMHTEFDLLAGDKENKDNVLIEMRFAPPSGHQCVCQWPPGVASGRG